MIRQYYLLLLLLSGLGTMAQQSAILEGYVQEGLQNNLALKQEGLEIRKANEAIQQAKALFYPKVRSTNLPKPIISLRLKT